MNGGDLVAELEVTAVPKNLREVFDFVTEELKKRTDDKKFLRQIKLVVEEIFLNISSYAYHPDVGKTKIAVRVEGDPVPVRVILIFKDSGQPFDPLSESQPDLDADLDERPVGGLGIFLVRNTVDGIQYEYQDGQNVLTITKEVTAEPEQV